MEKIADLGLNPECSVIPWGKNVVRPWQETFQMAIFFATEKEYGPVLPAHEVLQTGHASPVGQRKSADFGPIPVAEVITTHLLRINVSMPNPAACRDRQPHLK